MNLHGNQVETLEDIAWYSQHYEGEFDFSDNKISNIDYMSLVNDLISNNYEECTTISELENRFKISRLTEKDLNAQVLKIGNHGECNATSIPFLDLVK